jgi:hypothetical protein
LLDFLPFLHLIFYSYKALLEESSVATVSFERLAQQHYRATLVDTKSGTEKAFDIRGDLWQIDARLLKWTGVLAGFGFQPGYRLDRFQGRYLSLEQERADERTVYSLVNPDIGFDFWHYLHSEGQWIPWVDAKYGSATYLPMADGGIFSVMMTASGLVARALNERAEMAVNAWQ